MNRIFVSWAVDNGRTRDLGRLLGVPVFFVGNHGRGGNLAIRYLKQATETASILHRHRPKSLMIMLPPTPLLIIAVIYAFLVRGRLIADLHTGFFNDPKWAWARRISLVLLRGHVAVVTNPALSDVVQGEGVRALVVDDPLEDRRGEHTPIRNNSGGETGVVICPLGYANDEPIPAILEAAYATPTVRWVFTGKAPDYVRKQAPSNVHFTGYLQQSAFEGLLDQGDIVLALTTRDHTMQRAGYEALMHGKPVVTSDYALLRDYFGSAGIYADPSGADLGSAISRGIGQKGKLTAAAVQLLAEKLVVQEKQLVTLRLALEDVS